MTEHAARAIARAVHKGQKTAAGGPIFAHLRRVAAAVPPQARVTAWLHDILERTDVTIAELRAQGVSPVELNALVLLTRPQGDDYRCYVERLADALGPAGALARVVKLADLEDHLADNSAASPSAPPYAWGRRTILLAHTQASSSIRKASILRSAKRALADAPLLVIDEPTSRLDPSAPTKLIRDGAPPSGIDGSTDDRYRNEGLELVDHVVTLSNRGVG